jgi:diguanylate cyclase (GGDEF)-like protein
MKTDTNDNANHSSDMAGIREIERILHEQNIRTVYQPIVSLADGSIYGYEGLTRGPLDSSLHSPIELFDAAQRAGYLYQLERLAREKAIRHSFSDKQQMLFINVSSHIIYDPRFTPGQTLEVLQQCGLKPNNVVFEITERSSIEDFKMAKMVLEHYRSQGYRIAIDDAGAGYSSLQAIAELHPDFIKIDRSLIQHIHQDKMKEHIVETFVAFAEKMQVKLVAEGIEHSDELIKLTRLGIHLGQGFLLGRPALEPAVIPDDLVLKIIQQRGNHLAVSGVPWTIGDLASPVKQVAPTEPTLTVANYFQADESAQAVVVVDGSKPVGLIMRERLFQLLAGQYGFSLYWRKPVTQVMDVSPLIVEDSASVEHVSQQSMNREKSKLYDLVVITSGGSMAGVASIRSILECITNVRMESAKVANPPTGLPGNVQIHRELSRRAGDGKTFAVIYADLDYFKWFNDRYGFQRGDQLIQYTADTIQHAISVCGHPHDFVGHIGGDDFIAITGTDDPKRLCREIIRRFDQSVKLLYDGEDVSFIEDRNGNRVEGAGVTVSLSLIVCECTSPFAIEDISQEAARLKKQAKSHRGSICVSRTLGDWDTIEAFTMEYGTIVT